MRWVSDEAEEEEEEEEEEECAVISVVNSCENKAAASLLSCDNFSKRALKEWNESVKGAETRVVEVDGGVEGMIAEEGVVEETEAVEVEAVVSASLTVYADVSADAVVVAIAGVGVMSWLISSVLEIWSSTDSLLLVDTDAVSSSSNNCLRCASACLWRARKESDGRGELLVHDEEEEEEEEEEVTDDDEVEEREWAEEGEAVAFVWNDEVIGSDNEAAVTWAVLVCVWVWLVLVVMMGRLAGIVRWKRILVRYISDDTECEYKISYILLSSTNK